MSYYTQTCQILIAWILALACFTGTPLFAQNDSSTTASTLSYERPVSILANGEAIDLTNHATTRFFDWDHDADLDLLVGGGDGRLWLFPNVGTPEKSRFDRRQPIMAGKRDRWGNAYTGVLLVNLVGGPLADLLVCHSGNQVSLHENVGTKDEPKFLERGLTFDVQKNCQGRLDAADWNGDGTIDLITGSFGGELQWHPNVGTAKVPKFGAGQAFFDLRSAYNAHPRIVDFNHDGRLDLLLGNNWGSVTLYLNQGAGEPTLEKKGALLWTDGTDLNIRSNNGDDTTPELVDLDNDQVVDLVSGGANGQVFWMRGVGVTGRIAKLKTLLEAHADDLGKQLSKDDVLRKQLFGLLVSMQSDLASGLLTPESSRKLFSELVPLAKQFPQFLQRQKFDLKKHPYLPMLAAQYWVVLLESLPDTQDSRELVADAVGFDGGYRQLLIDLGVLFIDNNVASKEHLAAMHQLMMAMPREAWDVETITVAGWLGDGIKTQKIRSRSGVNIFDLPLQRTEDSFPADSPRPGVTDVYLICLAHEIAHNMLDTVGRKTRPDLFEAKFEGLANAAGKDIVFRTPKSRGIDLDATKQNFAKLGLWDGDPDHWKEAWDRYFRDQERFDRSYTRGNVKFFLDSPQEAFATLANQYFADSQLMLDFCKTRWDAGHRSNINQFLLIADYLSGGANEVKFYTLRPGGALRVTTAALERDSQARITSVRSSKATGYFKYENDSLVSDFELVAPNKKR